MSSATLAGYVDALFWVYSVLIFIRVLFSWVGIPSQRTLLIIFRYIYDLTEPYLGIFRRFIPSMGGIDFSPLVGLLVLNVLRGIIVSLIKG